MNFQIKTLILAFLLLIVSTDAHPFSTRTGYLVTKNGLSYFSNTNFPVTRSFINKATPNYLDNPKQQRAAFYAHKVLDGADVAVNGIKKNGAGIAKAAALTGVAVAGIAIGVNQLSQAKNADKKK